jgi:UDPglucose 6-dehydrogenase
VLASKNPHLTVTVVDCNPTRINAWNSKTLPIFEPGLSDLISSVRGKNLYFSTDIERALMDAQLIFLCVGTPPKTSGSGVGMAADLT